MKATGHSFYVVLFIMLYKVVLTLKCVAESLACDHANESYVLLFNMQYKAILKCS